MRLRNQLKCFTSRQNAVIVVEISGESINDKAMSNAAVITWQNLETCICALQVSEQRQSQIL